MVRRWGPRTALWTRSLGRAALIIPFSLSCPALVLGADQGDAKSDSTSGLPNIYLDLRINYASLPGGSFAIGLGETSLFEALSRVATIANLAELRAGLPDADELAPDRGEDRGRQDIVRIVAERRAIAADVVTDRADLMMSGNVKQSEQHAEGGGEVVHAGSPYASSPAPLFAFTAAVRHETPRLTRRANQVQIGIIDETIEPAPLHRQRVFHWRAQNSRSSFSPPKTICRIFIKFDTSGKSPA